MLAAGKRSRSVGQEPLIKIGSLKKPRLEMDCLAPSLEVPWVARPWYPHRIVAQYLVGLGRPTAYKWEVKSDELESCNGIYPDLGHQGTVCGPTAKGGDEIWGASSGELESYEGIIPRLRLPGDGPMGLTANCPGEQSGGGVGTGRPFIRGSLLRLRLRLPVCTIQPTGNGAQTSHRNEELRHGCLM